MRDGEGSSGAAGIGVPLRDDLTFEARVSGTITRCLLDTGSTISILHQSLFDSFTGVKLFKTSTQARTASKDPLPLSGRVTLKFELGGVTHMVPFYVSEVIDTPCLLGLDFLQHVPCVIDLRK